MSDDSVLVSLAIINAARVEDFQTVTDILNEITPKVLAKTVASMAGIVCGLAQKFEEHGESFESFMTEMAYTYYSNEP